MEVTDYLHATVHTG